MLKQAYPNKNIIVTEVGWPSNGASRRSPGSGLVKYATPAEQAKNIRDAVAWLRSAEHRASSWSRPSTSRGSRTTSKARRAATGACGTPTAQQKFTWTGTDRALPAVVDPARPGRWRLALPLMLLFLWRWRDLGTAGQIGFCGLAALVDQRARLWRLGRGRHLHAGRPRWWAGRVLAFFLAISLVMALMQALEMVETIWRRRWSREALPAAEMIARQPADRDWPKVSLHRRDLQRAAGDGDPDPRVAGRGSTIPTSKSSSSTTTPRTRRCGGRCRTTAPSLGERFRFFHFDVMKGFKAGALNYVLSQTAPDAKIIGVIDSDYMVRPDWLKAAGAVLRRPQDRLRAGAAGPSRLERTTASRRC